MTETATTLPEEQHENREPDYIATVIEWIDNPRETAMKAVNGEPKLQRQAKVELNGKTGVVPVIGTAKQFEFGSAAEVECYRGEKSGQLFFSPHLAPAGVNASVFGL